MHLPDKSVLRKGLYTALRFAPPHPTLTQPFNVFKRKRACRHKQHTLIGIISNVEKLICCFFTVCGKFKTPRDNESLPVVGEYSVILDSHDEAVCIIRTEKVYVVEFDQVTAEHAWKEGEGDRSLEYWRKVHEDFLSKELAEINRSFNGHTKVVCEEFEMVFPSKYLSAIQKGSEIV